MGKNISRKKKALYLSIATVVIVLCCIYTWEMFQRNDHPKSFEARPEIDGDYVVWLGGTVLNEDVYLRQISTGDTTNVSHNRAIGYILDVSGDYVLWQNYKYKAFLYQISTGDTKVVAKYSSYPKIDGDYVVWCNTEEHFSEVHLYQISTGITSQIAEVSNGMRRPEISGDYVVWATSSGGGMEVFLHQISENETTRIWHQEASIPHLKIVGDHVWWWSYEEGKSYLYKISTNDFVEIPGGSKDMQVHADHLAWSEEIDGDKEVFLHQISTGTTTQITDNTTDDLVYQVNDDYVLWVQSSEPADEIYLYQIETGKTIQVSNMASNAYEVKIDGDYVVWHDYSDAYLAELNSGFVTRLE